MAKVSILSMKTRMDRQGNNHAATPAVQVSRLTHAIMNHLTIIYLSCAKLRRGLDRESAANEDSDIQIIESAVAKVAAQVEALRFRVEKATRPQVKARSGKPQKQLGSKPKLSFISPRGIEKT